MKWNKFAALYILAAHICVLILYHIYGYIGHYAFDDMAYARLAHDLTNGVVDYSDHFTYRFSLIFLTAVSYTIFGLSDFASALPSLLATMGILIMVFVTLRREGLLTITLGLSLSLFANWFIFYSDKLMTDMLLAFSVMLVIFLIHRFKYVSNRSQPLLYGCLLTVALFIGVISKESIILILPLLGIYMISDFLHKRDRRFWVYTILSGLAILVLYLVLIWFLTGNLLGRWDALMSNSYLNLCSYDQQSTTILLRRVGYMFYQMMFESGMITAFIFIIPYFMRRPLAQWFMREDTRSFYMVTAAILLLSCNFMTVSPTSYVPLCLDPRHYLFLVPIAAIPAAYILRSFLQSRTYRLPVLFVSLAFTLMASVHESLIVWKLYAPITVLTGSFLVLKNPQRFQWVFAILFALILLVVPYDMVRYARVVKYDQQKETIRREITDKNPGVYILTDAAQQNLGDYYSAYRDDLNFQFIRFSEANFDSLADKPKYLLLNRHTLYLSGMTTPDLPAYARNPNAAHQILFEDDDLGIKLFELNDSVNFSRKGTTLLHALNTFESPQPHWIQNDEHLTQTPVYSGKNSILVEEFSATLRIPLDSIPWESYNSLQISSQVQVNFSDQTRAELIITIGTESNSYFYHPLPVNKYIKAYSNWWAVNFEVEIESAEIIPGSVLSVYIWNMERGEAYVDDFEVTVKGID